MKKWFIAALILLITLTFCKTSFAQDSEEGMPVKAKYMVSAFVIYGLPLGSFGNYNNSSFGGALQFEYLLAPMIGVDLTAGYIGWGATVDNKTIYSNYKYTMIPILIGGRYYFVRDDRSATFAGIDFGMYNTNYKNNQQNNSHSDFGFAVLGGEQFDLSTSFLMNINGSLNYINNPNNSSYFIGINAGLTYRF